MWRIVKLITGMFLVVVVALALLGKKTFHTEIIIPAELSEVWAVLNDTVAYGDWNPVFIKVEGNYIENARVINTVKDPASNILNINSRVTTVLMNKEIRQYGGIPGIITFDHRWLLKPVEGGTKVTQLEVDRGIYLWFWDSSWITPSYSKVNEALKQRVLQIRGRPQ